MSTSVSLDYDFLSGSSVGYYVNIIKNTPKGNAESNRKLIQEYQKSNDPIARELLIKSNLGLVLIMAKKYKDATQSFEFIDIIQEGIFGLIKAIETFSLENGASFSSYACTVIENSIKNALKTFDKEIRRPSNFISLMFKYKNYISKYIKDNKPIPDDDTICTDLGITKNRLATIKNDYLLDVKSLDAKVGNDNDDYELLDTIESDKNELDDMMFLLNDKGILLGLKKILKPHEYYLLSLRVFTDKKVTFEELSKKFLVSKQALQQVETRMRNYLKDYILSNGIDSLTMESFDESTEPINPEEVISYLFFRDSLSDLERKLYKLIVSKEYTLTQSIICKKLNITLDQLKKIYTSLNRKINNKDERLVDAYNYFKEEVLKKYGYRILSIDLDTNLDDIENNAMYTAKVWENLPFEDVQKIIKANNVKVSNATNKLISRYFNDESNIVRHVHSFKETESEINKILFGFHKKSNELLTGLYELLLKKRSSFKEEEYDYLMMKLFNKMSKKEYRKKHPHATPSLKELINKLESMYFNITNYREYNFTKEKYESIRDKVEAILSKDKIDLLDMFYLEGLSIEQIANKLSLKYEDVKPSLANARKSAVKVYLKRHLKRDIEHDYYIPYILDENINISDLIRSILHEYLIDNLTYEEIALKHKLDTKKVSKYISDGIETLDFYRFGIFKVENKFTDEEISSAYNSSKFTKEEKDIIDMKLKGYTREVMIKKTGLTFERIAYILNKFYKKCKEVRASNVNISIKDIELEVNAHPCENVLNDTERTLLAEVYGIKCDLNPEGIKYGENEYRKRHPNFSKAYNKNHNNALKNIKLKRLGMLKQGSVAYMSREYLKLSLQDPRIPLDEKSKEYLYYSFELNGYPYKTVNEIAKIYNSTTAIVKHKIQRAFVTIFKYENDEKKENISFEYDVYPYLKYFTKSDQAILTSLYREKLSYEEIAKRHDLTKSKVENIVIRLDSYLHDLLDDTVIGFDFDYFWRTVDLEDVPFYGNKEEAKRLFYLYYEERKSTNEIVEYLNLETSPYMVYKIINNLMNAVLKRREGIKKINSYSYEDIKDYYNKYSNDMNDKERRIYERYITNYEDVRKENRVCLESRINIHSLILNDLIKEHNEDHFSIDNSTREEAINIIKNYSHLLTKTAINTLIHKYDIHQRELMSGSEQMKVLRFLSGINKSKTFDLTKSA